MVKFFICFTTAIVLSSPDPDDLAFLMNHLQPFASQWRAVGLQLGLLSLELDAIATTPLLIPGGPAAYLEEVLSRWLNRTPPFPTLSRLCDALRSRALDQSRIALELEQQYQRWRTGLSAVQITCRLWWSAAWSCLTLNPRSTITTLSICTITVGRESILLDRAPPFPTLSKLPYTRVNKRNSLLSAYCFLSACFFPGFAPG